MASSHRRQTRAVALAVSSGAHARPGGLFLDLEPPLGRAAAEALEAAVAAARRG